MNEELHVSQSRDDGMNIALAVLISFSSEHYSRYYSPDEL